MATNKPTDMTSTTRSGFNYTLSADTLNNYELIEVMAEVDSNPMLFPKVLKLLLGEEQKQALQDHLRTESGIVPLDKLRDELMDIFNTNQETKN